MANVHLWSKIIKRMQERQKFGGPLGRRIRPGTLQGQFICPITYSYLNPLKFTIALGWQWHLKVEIMTEQTQVVSGL
jgi:hypothetical protein